MLFDSTMTTEVSFSEIINCEAKNKLKSVQLGDAPEFFRIIKENQKYFSEFEFIAPKFETVTDVENVISHLINYKRASEGANYGFWANDQLVGLFTINKVDWKNQIADVGYWLIQSAAGKGLAFFGLCALRDNLKNLDFKILTATTAVSNIKSQKLLLKAGFNKEKILEKNITVNNKSIDEILFTCHLQNFRS
jgi:ribosomal-protein-serine acetyltransferase